MNIVTLMMRENERITKMGGKHMTIPEMRFIVGGVGGPKALEGFDRLVVGVEKESK